MDMELRVQIPIIKGIIRAMGFMIFEIEGVEADDVLGSYAQAAKNEGRDLIIATGDKDLCVLIDNHICRYVGTVGTQNRVLQTENRFGRV